MVQRRSKRQASQMTTNNNDMSQDADHGFKIKSFYGSKKRCMNNVSLSNSEKSVVRSGRNSMSKSKPSISKWSPDDSRQTARKPAAITEKEPQRQISTPCLAVSGTEVGSSKKFFKTRTGPVRATFQLVYNSSKTMKRSSSYSNPRKFKKFSNVKRKSYRELEFHHPNINNEEISNSKRLVEPVFNNTAETTDENHPPDLELQTGSVTRAQNVCDIPPILIRQNRVERSPGTRVTSSCIPETVADPSKTVSYLSETMSTELQNAADSCNTADDGSSGCNSEIYSQDLFSDVTSEKSFASMLSTPISAKSQVIGNTKIPFGIDIIDGASVLQDMTNDSKLTSSLVMINGKKCYPIFSPKSSPQQSKLNQEKLSPGSMISKSTPKRHTPVLKSLRQDGKEQMFLDFGQKEHATIECTTCGMIYAEKEPEDEAQHSKFHQRTINSLRYTGWKKERVVQEFPNGKIVRLSTDDKYAQRKIEAILKVVDEDLGFSDSSDRRFNVMKQIYLYVGDDKRVLGCCVAEPIRQAYRVLPQVIETLTSGKVVKPWCCSNDAVPCRCGISRIWVFKHARRQRIGSKLLDGLRYSFLLGFPLEKTDIAFTDPSPDGRSFATSYTGTSEFLVYK